MGCLVGQKLGVCHGAVWRRAVEGEWRGCPGLRAAGFFQVEKLELDVREGRGSSACYWNRALHKKWQQLSLLAFTSLIFTRPFKQFSWLYHFLWWNLGLDAYLIDSVFIPGPSCSVVIWPNLFKEFIFNLTLGNLKASKAKSLCRIKWCFVTPENELSSVFITSACV